MIPTVLIFLSYSTSTHLPTYPPGAICDPQQPVPQSSPTPPPHPQSGLRMRMRGSDVGHPLLGQDKHSKEFIGVLIQKFIYYWLQDKGL